MHQPDESTPNIGEISPITLKTIQTDKISFYDLKLDKILESSIVLPSVQGLTAYLMEHPYMSTGAFFNALKWKDLEPLILMAKDWLRNGTKSTDTTQINILLLAVLLLRGEGISQFKVDDSTDYVLNLIKLIAIEEYFIQATTEYNIDRKPYTITKEVQTEEVLIRRI